MSSIARVAICQITCHPAIYIGTEMWPEEPFIPQERTNTLSALSIQGFPVEELLNHCKSTYLKWQIERIKGIITFLKSLKPPPDILLFPEGAIPRQCLNILQKYAKETDSSVLAGTHSLQRLRGAKKDYEELGLPKKKIDKTFNSETTINGICPIFISDRTHLIEKKIFSPYEMTEISKQQTDFPKVGPYQVKLKKGTIIIDGECYVNNDATDPAGGIWLGDGVDPANNITYKPLAESGFIIQSGYLVYNNVDT